MCEEQYDARLPINFIYLNDSSWFITFRVIVETELFPIFFNVAVVKYNGRFFQPYLVYILGFIFLAVCRILVWIKWTVKYHTTFVGNVCHYLLPFSHNL